MKKVVLLSLVLISIMLVSGCIENNSNKNIDLENEYVKLWKETVLSQGVSEKYFNDHIEIIKVYPVENIYGNGTGIQFLHSFDWIIFEGIVNIPISNETYTYTQEEQVFYIIDAMKNSRFNIKELNKILSKRKAFDILHEKCSESLEHWELKYNPALWGNGDLLYRTSGEISYEENQCIQAEINLETGEITKCQPQSCHTT